MKERNGLGTITFLVKDIRIDTTVLREAIEEGVISLSDEDFNVIYQAEALIEGKDEKLTIDMSDPSISNVVQQLHKLVARKEKERKGVISGLTQEFVEYDRG